MERSLLFIILTALFAPFDLMAQPQVDRQVRLSPDFLNGRALAQSAGYGSESNGTAGDVLQRPAAPFYDVVALRVAFQPDTTRFTTGDGTFTGVLFDTLSSRVDPLPHDDGYFEAHLQFLSNYVTRVSDGKTRVVVHLVPEVIHVSKQMAAYSPTGFEAGSDAELVKLAKLVEEAWTLADRQSSFDMSGFDPATTALVLFHAGVGRDIELVGTTLDKTPQDLPTIFFNQSTLDRLLPASELSFNGFPVQHTILMPRTESRLGFDFLQDAPFLVEFSINGLLAASFFNYLDAPDLFDTETGESAIGPFGLMDPLGLFAYNGLFPPEPSAWTKFYLGWTDPVVVEGADDQTIYLNAAGGLEDVQHARVPISNSEYFLVENRNRDLAGDGLYLTIYRDGQTFTQRVENGQEDFNSFNIDGFDGGVVVDVDDFDWALPGGVDEDGNALQGGMLVWHIDERIIEDGLPGNAVNTDPVRRGVDLEEADGAQDLGFPTDNIFGPQAFLGSPFDFYYEGNPVVVISSTGEEIRLYQNRLGPATYPNSNSNAGGPSFIVLENFTPPGPVMSFDYRREPAGGITPLDGFETVESADVPPGSFVTSFQGAAESIVFQSGPGAVAINTRNTGVPDLLSSRRIKSPVVVPGDRLAVLGLGEQNEAAILWRENGSISIIPLGVIAENLAGDQNHLLYDNLENRLLALIDGEDTNAVIAIDLNPDNSFGVSRIAESQLPVFSIAVTSRGEVAILGTDGVDFGCCEQKWRYALPENARVGQLVLGEDESGIVGAIPHISGEKLVFLEADGSTNVIDLTPFEPEGERYALSRYPVLVDLDRDNKLEVLATYGPLLLAFSAGGGMADGFPIEMPAASSTQPLIASFADVEDRVVLVGASDGYIYAFQTGEPAGRQAPGFPLGVGESITATPLLKDNVLYGVDGSGSLRAWEVGQLTEVFWGSQHGDRYNTNFFMLDTGSQEAGTGESRNELLVSDENYNWPNPIRHGETFFRLAPTQDVRVEITIIDAAGGLVEKIEVENVRGNTTTDIRWQTDAASGLYFARVEAVAADGTSETRLIKMAIIR